MSDVEETTRLEPWAVEALLLWKRRKDGERKIADACRAVCLETTYQKNNFGRLD